MSADFLPRQPDEAAPLAEAWPQNIPLQELIETLRLTGEFPVRPSPLSQVQWMKRFCVHNVQQKVLGQLIIVGNGPFATADLCRKLDDLRVTYRMANNLADERIEIINPEAVVLGEEPCHEQMLLSLISRSASDSSFRKVDAIRCIHEDGSLLFRRSDPDYIPRIYSQEMLLFRVLTGIDALQRGEAFLFRHIQEHHALRFLDAHRGFEWAELGTRADHSAKQADLGHERGMLGAFGYHVGRTGASTERRREILAQVFCSEKLPAVNSVSYVMAWGAHESAVRLRQIACAIARQWRLRRAHMSECDDALLDWEADLGWLKKKFYDGRFDNCFEWPKP